MSYKHELVVVVDHSQEAKTERDSTNVDRRCPCTIYRHGISVNIGPNVPGSLVAVVIDPLRWPSSQSFRSVVIYTICRVVELEEYPTSLVF
jgi:hypothetical protein